MNWSLLFFLLALIALGFLLFGMIKPGKVLLGASSTRSKVGKVYGFAFLALFIAFAVSVPESKKSPADIVKAPPLEEQHATPAAVNQEPTQGEASPQSQAEQATVTLGITPEEFRRNFNELVGSVDTNYKTAEFDITDGPVNNTFTRTLSNGIALVGTVSKTDHQLKGVIVIIANIGKDEIARAMAVQLATAAAANPDAPRQQVSQAVLDVLKEAGENMNSSASATRVVGDVEYSASMSDVTGLMFFISPKE